MMRTFFRRRSRTIWQRLMYLCMISMGILFITSQLKSDARVIPEVEKVNKHENPLLVPIRVVEAEKIADKSSTVREIIPVVKQRQKDVQMAENYVINGEKYPKLNSDGKFIPLRRIVHLDLKGAPYKPSFFPELFSFLNRLQATGILIEWEDMFPYKGKLSKAINKNAYTMEEVEKILEEARKRHLQILPLVQTLGHLEWILKVDEFAEMREDPRIPQVICFSDERAWELVKEMLEQVIEVHRKYGMEYFHIGADEAFQVGICEAAQPKLSKEGSIQRLMMWHIARTAQFVKDKAPGTTVMAWHDMLVNGMDQDLQRYNLTELIQPVLWNYAEDLDIYLPRSHWMILKDFGRVWGSSAWKGADGPARFSTHSMHYIKNHESWTNQLTSVYQDFEAVEGIILAGWSRYDHLAILTEMLPVAIPTMSMCMETIMEGRKMNEIYPNTQELLQCTPPTGLGLMATDCRFPGSRIYELINTYYQKRRALRKYQDEDYELNGWLSRMADKYSVSSMWYIDKIQPVVESYALPIEELERDLRFEMQKIYFNDTIDEFIYTYMGESLEWIKRKRETIENVEKMTAFPRRPY